MVNRKSFFIIGVLITQLVEINCRTRNKAKTDLKQELAELKDLKNSEDVKIYYEGEYDDEDDPNYNCNIDVYNGEEYDENYVPVYHQKTDGKQKKSKKQNSNLKSSKSPRKKSPKSNKKAPKDSKSCKKQEQDSDGEIEIIKVGKQELNSGSLGHFSNSQSAACSLKLNKDISKKNEPLFLVKDDEGIFKLALPDLISSNSDKYTSGVGAIQFDKNEAIYLSCPGKNNGINGSDSCENTPSEITCVGGTQVSLHMGQVEKLSESSKLTCQKPAAATAIFSEDKTPCGNNEGSLIELGFSAEGWHKLIDVCFNVEEIKTLYAKHKLYGSVLAGAVVDSNRPRFTKGQNDFYNGFNPDEYYKQANEKKILHEIGCGFDVSQNLYLARGHFAPDADFIFKAWQDATYFFVNAAPQWQSINQGHWLSVERLARNLAMKLKEDLDIVTGPYGKMERYGNEIYLEIPENNNSPKKKTVKPKIPKLSVPNYYWKLIHRPENNECIVLVSTNNPFIEEPEEICTDICKENGWPELKEAMKGFVSCCSYDDFKNTVSYVPEYNCTGGILQGP